MADAALASGRTSFDGPLNINLRSPEMAKLEAPLTAYLRFKSTAIPPNLKQIGIMLTARFWGGQYVWYSHRQQALDAGLSAAFIDAMAAGVRPANMTSDETIVFDFCNQLLQTRQVDDAVFKAMADRFGERGIVELVGLMGQYHTLSMLFSVDRYPLPDGARQEIDRPK
jgi:4-carboxymuconolactone decarboxylase